MAFPVPVQLFPEGQGCEGLRLHAVGPAEPSLRRCLEIRPKAQVRQGVGPDGFAVLRHGQDASFAAVQKGGILGIDRRLVRLRAVEDVQYKRSRAHDLQ